MIFSFDEKPRKPSLQKCDSPQSRWSLETGIPDSASSSTDSWKSCSRCGIGFEGDGGLSTIIFGVETQVQAYEEFRNLPIDELQSGMFAQRQPLAGSMY